MGFHNMHFYSPTLTALSRHMHFYMLSLIDPYIRGFRQVAYHSDHRQFIDPRHVSDTAHLWAGFVAKSGFYGRLLPTSPGYPTSVVSHRSRPEYQGERFRALPLHSTLWIISSQN